MMYVVMDGFDLGIGILFPFVGDRSDRDLMVNTVAPVWDGNETWLVLGGAALMGAFPLAYSVAAERALSAAVLHAAGPDLARRRLRVPLQGDASAPAFWDMAFAGGSYSRPFSKVSRLAPSSTASTCQGTSYVGGTLRLAHAIQPVYRPWLCILAYALLGSTWLIMKTEGDAAAAHESMARPITLGAARRDRRRQPLDAARASAKSPPAGSRFPTSILFCAGAGARRCHHDRNSTC